ncbi:MAG: hypothetical protein SGI88_06235 [Candidatus Hydrogenedentes bacterium]|nr:hypothetical protein [Candidatus Hydrogenedentota bacterium]
MITKTSWKDWHTPISRGDVTLTEAHSSLKALGAKPQQIPLMVQLVENPKYAIPGLDPFHGRVDLHMHDIIHIILGRGLLAEDEAFVIGFTMGSTNRVTTTEERLYSLVSKYLYPKVYRFTDDCIRIFKDATKLAYISDSTRLDEVDFDAYMDWTLDDLRDAIHLEHDLLMAYYKIEHRRFPNLKGSARLLD